MVKKIKIITISLLSILFALAIIYYTFNRPRDISFNISNANDGKVDIDKYANLSITTGASLIEDFNCESNLVVFIDQKEILPKILKCSRDMPNFGLIIISYDVDLSEFSEGNHTISVKINNNQIKTHLSKTKNFTFFKSGIKSDCYSESRYLPQCEYFMLKMNYQSDAQKLDQATCPKLINKLQNTPLGDTFLSHEDIYCRANITTFVETEYIMASQEYQNIEKSIPFGTEINYGGSAPCEQNDKSNNETCKRVKLKTDHFYMGAEIYKINSFDSFCTEAKNKALEIGKGIVKSQKCTYSYYETDYKKIFGVPRYESQKWEKFFTQPEWKDLIEYQKPPFYTTSPWM